MKRIKLIALLTLLGTSLLIYAGGHGDDLGSPSFLNEIEQLADRPATAYEQDVEEMRTDMLLRERERIQDANDSQQLANETANESQEEHDKKIAYSKWQNTLLTPIFPIGIYVRDLFEFPKIVGDLAADVLMYKNLSKRRIEAIYEKVINNHEAFLNVLRHVKDAQEQASRTYDDMTALQKALSSKQGMLDSKLAPLKEYVKEQHRLVGVNPFTRETIIPLVLRFGWQKMSDHAIEQFVLEDTRLVDFKWKECFKEAGQPLDLPGWTAYQNRGGQLVALRPDDMPLSASNIANFFLNPIRSTMAKLTNHAVSKVDMGWFRSLLGIPAWLYGKEMRFAAECASMGFAAQIYDQINTSEWLDYIINNRDKLRELLEEYGELLKSVNEEELANARNKLKKFIIKGHTPASWIPGSLLRRWWHSMESGKMQSVSYTLYPYYAGVAVKLGKAAHWAFNIFFR